MIRATSIALALFPGSAFANFTENNLLAIFYHELGHAVIDQMQVPIFGQEEDAADAMSILLVDALYDSESAEQIAYDSAALFWSEAQQEPAFWDTHGPDEQRFYNTICLFYGADPDARAGFAEELELPEERAVGCEEEYELAAQSWNAVLDEMSADRALTGRLVLTADVSMPVLAKEIEALNAEFKWPRNIPVNVTNCDEANAFYDLEDQSVTMCSELTAWLDGIAAELGSE